MFVCFVCCTCVYLLSPHDAAQALPHSNQLAHVNLKHFDPKLHSNSVGMRKYFKTFLKQTDNFTAYKYQHVYIF